MWARLLAGPRIELQPYQEASATGYGHFGQGDSCLGEKVTASGVAV